LNFAAATFPHLPAFLSLMTGGPTPDNRAKAASCVPCATCGGLFVVLIALLLGTVFWEPCPDLEGLKGKHVVITGASSGIGRALALQYAKLGAKLTIAARRESKLQEVRIN
jgi:NADPH:quinone reductase-like Zn-dependent oxidoreductase